MRKTLRERIDISKVSRYSIGANALQILFAAGIFLYALFGRGFELTGRAEQFLVGAMALIVIWGAALDIRDAFNARRIARQSEMLEDAYGQLEDLNATLRAQRHDFMNHLQVVFGLIEMQDYAEAKEYIERVYGDIQLVGRSLKTAIPAVNALIAAKTADCEEKGIQMETRIRSSWQGMPVAGWELCRILGNLIDNAIDALESEALSRRVIAIEIGEGLREYTFAVENTGPEIPAAIRESVFERGFTTKRAGRGMGLSIVREIIRENGGDIQLTSNEKGTRFEGRIPRPSPPEEGV